MNNRVVIIGPKNEEIHKQGYFGEFEGDRLILSDVEALFLVDKEKIIVIDENGRILSFKDLVYRLSEKNENLWLKYLLYSDLRRRGYIVKEGYGGDLEFRVYRRGATIGKEPAKYLVYGLVEGRTISISELRNISNRAKLSNKDLIIAVIDRQGEITYYEALEINL